MDEPSEFGSHATGDDKELVTEQRIYRKVDEAKMFAAFEADLARQQKEDDELEAAKQRAKKEKKKSRGKDKHKHKKSDHKNKHKKKRKRHSSDSSDSSSSDGEDARTMNRRMEQEAADMDDADIRRAQRSQQNRISASTAASSDKMSVEPTIQREDWMLGPPKKLLGDQPKAKTSETEEKKSEGPTVSSKELNPQLNPKSTLEQPEDPKSYLVGDGGKRWKDRARMRDSQDSKESGRRDHDRRSGDSDRPHSDRGHGDDRRDDRYRREDRRDDRSRRSDRSDNTSRSDSRRDDRRPESDAGRMRPSIESTPAVPMVPGEDLSQVDPNKLASQIMKAELMGDNATVQQLKMKLERYKQYLKQDTDEDSGPKVVVVSDIDASGRSRSATTRKEIEETPDEDPNRPRKRRKITETYNEGERSRYFRDDDVDLKTLVDREKRSVGSNMDDAFADNLVRSSNFKMDVFQADNMDGDDVNYQMWESREKKMSKEKLMQRDRQKAIQEHKRMEDKEKQCYYCFQNRKIPKHMMLSLGEHCYVMLPDKQLVDFHCFIVPVEHEVALTTMEEAVWREVEQFMVSLSNMFQAHGFAAIFFETVLNFKHKKHTVVECIPVPKEDAYSAPVYFQKAILESESEWSQHKKLIDTSGKGIRKCIPPNFAYFYVQFGLNNGFAHVIEDDKKFSKFFGREIVAGMLKLDAEKYIIKPRRKTLDEERAQMQKMLEMFAKFDWTVQLDGGQL